MSRIQYKSRPVRLDASVGYEDVIKKPISKAATCLCTVFTARMARHRVLQRGLCGPFVVLRFRIVTYRQNSFTACLSL